jgi:hypothetical protein
MSFGGLLLVGPFARCKFEVNEVIEEVLDVKLVCLNANCKDLGKAVFGNYCAHCGQPARKSQSMNQVKKLIPSVQLHDWEEKLQEAGIRGEPLFEVQQRKERKCFPDWDTKELWFLPNQRRNAPREFILTSDELATVDIGVSDVEAEKAWFEEAFRKELDVLRSMFVEVTIDWRILSCYL